VFSLLALQWKQDLDEAVKLITRALEIDEKCDFAHETMGTIEVQRYCHNDVCLINRIHVNYNAFNLY